MDRQIITFRADNQVLVKLTGADLFASNIVSYVDAHFDLGTNWSGFDAVRAVWQSNTKIIATVVDAEGNCSVPAEMMRYPSRVNVNLVGSVSDESALQERLTTYPVLAFTVDKDTRIYSDETPENTPTLFEQFAGILDVESVVAEWIAAHPEYVTTVMDDSLTTPKYKDGSVTTYKIADDAITEDKIAPALKLKVLKDYVTPEMFGAAGDGVTDDTDAIQKAVNSGLPIIGLGKYLVTSPISAQDVIMRNVKIVCGAIESLFDFESKQQCKVILSNCEFDGDDKASYCMKCTVGSSSATFDIIDIDRLYMHNFLNYGIRLVGTADQCFVRNSKAENIGSVNVTSSFGFEIGHDGFGHKCNYISFSNITLKNIKQSPQQGSGQNANGIDVCAKKAVIENCYCENVDAQAIYFKGDYCEVVNNTIINCGKYSNGALAVKDTVYGVVNNNTIIGHGCCAYLRGTQEIRVSNNYFESDASEAFNGEDVAVFAKAYCENNQFMLKYDTYVLANHNVRVIYGKSVFKDCVFGEHSVIVRLGFEATGVDLINCTLVSDTDSYAISAANEATATDILLEGCNVSVPAATTLCSCDYTIRNCDIVCKTISYVGKTVNVYNSKVNMTGRINNCSMNAYHSEFITTDLALLGNVATVKMYNCVVDDSDGALIKKSGEAVTSLIEVVGCILKTRYLDSTAASVTGTITKLVVVLNALNSDAVTVGTGTVVKQDNSIVDLR